MQFYVSIFFPCPGISTKKDCIPTRFFVEYLRKEEGHKVVLTGMIVSSII